MAFNYSNLQATAERLISNFGQSATLIKTTNTGTEYNPSTSTSESTITLVELQYSLTNRNETLVQQGDKLWLVSTDGLDPDKADEIKLDGLTYRLVDVQPLSPGGTTLLFEIQARK